MNNVRKHIKQRKAESCVRNLLSRQITYKQMKTNVNKLQDKVKAKKREKQRIFRYRFKMSIFQTFMDLEYGNTGRRVFTWGIQNWKDFCLKINICTQRKLLNFENWSNGEVSKIGHHLGNNVI